jgi:hypothetical protein
MRIRLTEFHNFDMYQHINQPTINISSSRSDAENNLHLLVGNVVCRYNKFPYVEYIMSAYV